jgi:hypothetical protein
MTFWRRKQDSDPSELDRQFERTRREINVALDDLERAVERMKHREEARESLRRRRAAAGPAGAC